MYTYKEVVPKKKRHEDALAAVLVALGHAVEWRMRSIVVDGEDLSAGFDCERPGRWRFTAPYNGKVRFKLGNFGHVKQYPEPKAGHDFAKLAADVLAYRERKLQERERDRKWSEKVMVVEAVARRLNEGLSERLFSVSNGELHFNADLTQEQAEAFAELARKLGL